MANFVPINQHLREVMLRNVIQKKTAAETDRFLLQIYGEHFPSQNTCASIVLDGLKIMILMLVIKNALEHQKNLKAMNWKLYSVKIHVKRNKNQHWH